MTRDELLDALRDRLADMSDRCSTLQISDAALIEECIRQLREK